MTRAPMIAATVVGLSLAAHPAPGLDRERGAALDPRSHEVLKTNCSSSLGRREVTLFGNGTLRLRREGGQLRDAERELLLAELDPDERASYSERLRQELAVPDESRGRPGSASGEWVEQCELTVELEPGERYQYRFSRVDSLDLRLSRLVAIADELFSEAELRASDDSFPLNYEPQVGDVLVRADGAEFLIRAFTADGNGVEVEGVGQPLVLYLPKDDVRRQFVALARRGS